jgi:Na+-translocating ferredoxin:NAD+ oxidoreductase subunit D
MDSEKMKLLHLSGSPHIRSTISTPWIMNSVTLALMPVLGASMILYGFMQILMIVLVGSLTAVISEAILQKFLSIKFSYLDGSAFLTGLLLSLTLGPQTPLWMVALGSFVAIVSKQVYGGIGQNPFNPALIGRAFLLLSFPIDSTRWFSPFTLVTTATPLNVYKMNGFGQVGFQKVIELLGGTKGIAYKNLFFGIRGGPIGEACIPILMIGFLYLLMKKIVSWMTTVAYLLTVVILSYLFHLDILLMLMSGGILFGAFFMATDYVTSPLLPSSQIIYGFGIGFINILIRRFSGMPEGTTFSILIMNLLTPLLDFKIKKSVGYSKEVANQ